MRYDQGNTLKAYSRGEISAIDLRRRLGGIGYGDILRLLADAHLPLPRIPTAGREAHLDQARRWLFPHADSHN